MLSIVTQSYGTPSVSATICVCTVREPWPMSTVPAKTSTRPSGLSFTHAWLGSPFWFIPVGYSIVAIPRPLCLAISPHPRWCRRMSFRWSGRSAAGARLVRHRAEVGRQLVTDALRGREHHGDGGRVLELHHVPGQVADAVRVLQPHRERVEPEHLGDAVHVQLGRVGDRGHAEAAHRGRRHAVREHDVAVEAQVRDRVRAGVVERVLRQPVGGEARVGAGVVEGQHPAPEDPAVARDRVGDLHVPGRPRGRGEELLLARPAPLDRPLRLHGEQRADRLGGRVHLAAEAAADGAADELQLVQRALQVRGDDAHGEVHRLRAGVDRQPPVGLRHGERGLRLERAVLDRLRAVDALDDRVGLLERGLRRRPCGRAGGRAGRSGCRPAPTGGSAATRGRTPCACRRSARAPRRRSRSRRRRPARAPRSRRRRRRSAGPCSGPRPPPGAARRPGRRAPRGGRRRSAGRRPS